MLRRIFVQLFGKLRPVARAVKLDRVGRRLEAVDQCIADDRPPMTSLQGSVGS